MVLLACTARMRLALAELARQEPEHWRDLYQRVESTPMTPISDETVRKMAATLSQPTFALWRLLRGSHVVHVPPPEPLLSDDERAKRAQFRKYMDNLRRELEERDYQARIGGAGASEESAVSAIRLFSGTKAKDETSVQLSAVINIIFSMASVATALWWWSGAWSPGARVLTAATAALIVGGAEAWLFIRYWQATVRKRAASPRGETKEIIRQLRS